MLIYVAISVSLLLIWAAHVLICLIIQPDRKSPPMPDPNFAEQAQAVATIGGAGIAGRMVWALRQTQAGRRRFFSLTTLIDVVIAVPCAFLGQAGIELFQTLGWLGPVTPAVVAASCGVAGYLGPHAIDSAFGVIVRRADKG